MGYECIQRPCCCRCGPGLIQHHELLGVADRQLAQHELIHQCEYGGVGADPRASERMATEAKRGLRRIARREYRTSRARMVIILILPSGAMVTENATGESPLLTDRFP